MSWRNAACIDVLRQEIDQLAPGRSTVSDGTIGDADHQNRNSDHNPWVPPPNGGVVTAVDITHDPSAGCDADDLGEHFRQMGLSGDRRIKYVIRSRKIASSRNNWAWRDYFGSNPHTSHVHLSVSSTYYDDENTWGLTNLEDDVYVVKYNERGSRVKRAQKVLAATGDKIGVKLLPKYGADGHYGDETQEAVDYLAGRTGIEETGGKGMDILVLDYCRNWLSG